MIDQTGHQDKASKTELPGKNKTHGNYSYANVTTVVGTTPTRTITN